MTNTWDYRNRLSSTNIGATTTKYAYDPAGERLQHSINGHATTTYVTNAYSLTDDEITKHIYAGDLLVATVTTELPQVSGGMDSFSMPTPQIHYIHPDHLGGTNAVTDDVGNLEQTLDYYPFGPERISQGDGTDRHYIGELYDEETALSYLNARYHDGSRGQFLSQDPAFLVVGTSGLKQKTGMELQQYLSDPQGMNGYSYAKNNPLKYVDQDGNFWQVAVALGIIYSPQILSFSQSLLTPLGQVGLSQTIDDARSGNYTMAAIGAVTAGEFSGPQRAFTRPADTSDGFVKFATEYGRNLDFKMSRRSWSVGNIGDRLGSLVDHYVNHGEKVGAGSVGEYYNKANDFISNKGYTNMFREGADTVYYNEKTKFAVYTNRTGDISSFYRLTSQNKISNYLKRIKNQK